MKTYSVICLLLVASLSSCLSYDSGSDSTDTSIGSENVTQIDNSVSGSLDEREYDPCSPPPLWKPVSEADGKLAIVSQPGDVVKWNAVAVFVAEDGELEFCEYASLTPEGDRQVWRCDRPGEEYTGLFVIEYGSESCDVQVPNPSERND